MTIGQQVNVGPLHFTAIRILVAVGVLRTIVRGELLSGGMNRLDGFVLLWSAWAVASSVFHAEQGSLIFRLGLVYDAAGIYFLLRVFCSSLEDVVRLCRLTAILLVPVAVEMIYEHVAFHNLFSVFGGVPPIPQVREGKIRAFGPFLHPILAGTVGAVSLPMMVGLWREHRKTALLGIVVCFSIVLSSASSGPFMSMLAGVAGLCMWNYRRSMRTLRWFAVFAYIFLDIVMKAPAYYVIARMDVVGGSTGYHRARLIESALEHLNEWWLTGTDYTRHWMPTGVSWSPNHTDITNHYLQMGVLGGLPLMVLFILLLVTGFSFVGRRVRDTANTTPERRFLVWALGSSLFAHAVTSISVSYFDQSITFLYLTIAGTGSLYVRVKYKKQRPHGVAHGIQDILPYRASIPETRSAQWTSGVSAHQNQDGIIEKENARRYGNYR